MTTRRLFYALWPDNRQRDRMHDFISPVAELVDGRAIDRRDWHVTLVYVGLFPADRVDELLGAAGEIQVDKFRLCFDRLEYWPRPKIAALVAATVPPELDQLVETLQDRVLAAGIEPERRRYRPHITLARNARRFETQRLARSAITKWSSFELIESISKRGGATYRPIVNDF